MHETTPLDTSSFLKVILSWKALLRENVPIPSPRQKRAMKRCHQVEVKACQTVIVDGLTSYWLADLAGFKRLARPEKGDLLHVADDIMHVRKMVPLLPRYLFRG